MQILTEASKYYEKLPQLYLPLYMHATHTHTYIHIYLLYMNMSMYLLCHSCWAKRFAQPAATVAAVAVPSANDSLTWLPLPYSPLRPRCQPLHSPSTLALLLFKWQRRRRCCVVCGSETSLTSLACSIFHLPRHQTMRGDPNEILVNTLIKLAPPSPLSPLFNLFSLLPNHVSCLLA